MPATVIGRSSHRLPIADVMALTWSGAAIVRTPTVPIGHSELSMSMVCLARRPCGVLIPIGTPYVVSATGAGVAVLVQPQASPTVSAAATDSVVALRALCLSARNVQDNLELEQGRSRGHRVCGLSLVRLDGGASRPRLESLFRLPLGDHEVAVFALDRAQELEAEEAWLVVDGVRTVCEPLLQFRARVGRHLDCVDLHHNILAGHGVQATVPWHARRLAHRPRRSRASTGACARPDG